MELLSGTLVCEKRTGSPLYLSQQFTFSYPVQKFHVALAGFTARYSDHQDHHLGKLEINLGVRARDPYTLVVYAYFGLRDYSGEWDDPYEGAVNFSLFVEGKPRPGPALAASFKKPLAKKLPTATQGDK